MPSEEMPVKEKETHRMETHSRRRIGTRSVLSVLGAAALIGVAAPAYAEPEAGGGDTAFLASLRSVGLAFASDDRAVAAGHAVCGLISNGEPGLQVLQEVKRDNPGLSLDGASQFAALAANSYCPQQLTK